MLCALKHFPGRGAGAAGRIYEREIDLKPFLDLARHENAGLIMFSTQTFPQLDSSAPAHKSKLVHELLRAQGQQNVLLTDDVSSGNLTEAELQAEILALLAAGNDLILLANKGGLSDSQLSVKLRRVVQNILKNKLISAERLEESFGRILAVKQRHNIEPKEIYLNYAL
ncbi:glycoside hydrolase family 3 [Candidatus Termititenax persephonae]|uniref:beta-N-acetylhexosaminidase n=1 Tax=Candidatus Termititenax persephonae TaxID=2218525 RepID=A0A388TIB4_9BACT|nr:glycoside hydrolase family 3 [Candidatus Termititenax persephonae]